MIFGWPTFKIMCNTPIFYQLSMSNWAITGSWEPLVLFSLTCSFDILLSMFQYNIIFFNVKFLSVYVELLSSLWRHRRLSFLSRVHFSKTIKGIHLKLGILVHYQKRNQLQQGRWPCDLYIQSYLPLLLYPCSPKGEGSILFYLCPSVRSSKIFFVAFFSVTVDGRNLIFGHKRHIDIPYCGYRFWICQIPTSCLLT